MDNAVCHKTVRSLGSKFASLVLSMTYGLHAGYFVTFIATELLLFVMERLLLEYASSEYVQFDSLSTVSKGLLMAAGYIWMWTALGYAVVPFEQKRLDRRLKGTENDSVLLPNCISCVDSMCCGMHDIESTAWDKRDRNGDSSGFREQHNYWFQFHSSQSEESNQLGLQGQTVNRMRLQQCSIGIHLMSHLPRKMTRIANDCRLISGRWVDIQCELNEYIWNQ